MLSLLPKRLVITVLRPVTEAVFISIVIASVSQTGTEQRANNGGKHSEDAEHADSDVGIASKAAAGAIVISEADDGEAETLCGGKGQREKGWGS